jgi:hypothetical protein
MRRRILLLVLSVGLGIVAAVGMGNQTPPCLGRVGVQLAECVEVHAGWSPGPQLWSVMVVAALTVLWLALAARSLRRLAFGGRLLLLAGLAGAGVGWVVYDANRLGAVVYGASSLGQGTELHVIVPPKPGAAMIAVSLGCVVAVGVGLLALNGVRASRGS